LCLTRSDIWEAKMRINELEEKDKEKKWRAGVYFEEALATIEEQKFKEKKRGNPDGNPRTLSPVDEMWMRKEEAELREIERSGLVTEEGMEMLWRKFRERYENPHTIGTMRNPSGNPTEIYECPEGGWGITEIDGIYYLTRQGVVQRRITEGDFGYAELMKHICPIHDVELVKR